MNVVSKEGFPRGVSHVTVPLFHLQVELTSGFDDYEFIFDVGANGIRKNTLLTFDMFGVASLVGWGYFLLFDFYSWN